MEILLWPLAVLALVFPYAGAILLNLRSGRAAKKRHPERLERTRKTGLPEQAESTAGPRLRRRTG